MAEVDGNSTIAKETPKDIPENWVVNPHNNPDISMIGKADERTGKKWIPGIRENWISPEALEKICPGCKHKRETNEFYSNQA